jgi:MFS family permease
MSAGATLLHLRGTAGMDAIYRKISWRLLPLLMLGCALAWLDRVNLGYAQSQMQHSLAFGDQAATWGAVLFFLGYCLFQLPSNLLLQKIGARKVLPRLLVCWGLAAGATAFVRTPFQLYGLRLVLGVFEAGFFPGVIYYLSCWYPARRRARVYAIFATAALAAAAVAAPLSGYTLQALHGLAGLQGWQWLLLTQGLPAALAGMAAWLILVERPDDADWLSSFEQQMVEQELERDEAPHAATAQDRHDGDAGAAAVSWALVRDPSVALLAVSNLLLIGAAYALAALAPDLLRRWGIDGADIQPAWLAVLPYVAGIVGMVAIGHDSDRRRERRGHFVACMVLAAGGLGLAIAANEGLAWSLAGLSLAVLGVASAAPLLLAILADLLPRRHAATGIALVCSAGAAGGAFAPTLGARLLNWGGSAVMLAALSGVCLTAGVMLLLALRLSPLRTGPDAKHGTSDKMARN